MLKGEQQTDILSDFMLCTLYLGICIIGLGKENSVAW